MVSTLSVASILLHLMGDILEPEYQHERDSAREVHQGIPGGSRETGELQLHQTSSINTVFRYIWRGAPVAIARLPEVTTEMWAVAITKNAPHPNAARLFADFFTSPEGQLAYANAQGVPISSPEAARLAKTNLAVKELGLKTFMAPPEVWTQENIKKAQSFWSELMRR